jgi:signal recognition particle GTPase
MTSWQEIVADSKEAIENFNDFQYDLVIVKTNNKLLIQSEIIKKLYINQPLSEDELLFIKENINV